MKTVLIPGKWLLALVVVILLLIASGTSYYFYNQYKTTKEALKNPDQASRKELEAMVEKVGKITELPEGEAPTLATVSDVSKLNSQTFFQRAQNGDKVLIYTNARKAFLYRPATNKIVEIGPINNENEGSSSAQVAGAESQPQPSPTPSEISLVLFNGTKTSGLATKLETQLKKEFPAVKVMAKSNAKNDYEKTVVVVLESYAKQSASQIAKNLNAELKEKTPDGEYPPAGADIIIFLGSDRS
jgi:hypothetical protein